MYLEEKEEEDEEEEDEEEGKYVKVKELRSSNRNCDRDLQIDV